MVLLSTLVYFQVFHCQFQVNCRVRQINKLVLLSRRTKEDRRDSEKQVFIFIKTKKLHSCWCFYCCTSGIGKFQMVPAYFIVCFLFSHLLLPHSAEEQNTSRQYCPTFQCGKFGKIGFPFTNASKPECGLFMVDNCTSHPKINLGGKWYEVKSISQGGSIIIHGPEFLQGWKSCNPDSLNKKFTFPGTTFYNFSSPNVTLFKCNHSLNISLSTDFKKSRCNNNITIFYNYLYHTLPTLPPKCSFIQLPLNDSSNQIYSTDPLQWISSEDFSLDWHVSQECYQCNLNGGQCQDDLQGKFHCANATDARIEKGRKNSVLKLALAIGCPAIFILCLLPFIFWCGKKWKSSSSSSSSRNIPFYPSSKSELETGSIYFGLPVFSYSELEEATNNFDPAKEIGDGGFGTVYHGELQDGREVAVKRLYESNYRRVQQFMNEVEILTGLHHKNLVSLYGCTSCHSRELLLVYEFIPNGTVADHLHGDKAEHGSLTWPIRMSIAIETAEALAFLHESDIVHRDVKTNNILLDNNFCVKVADFGLSRLFPTDVSHVSTAPQGTPGYVDPEYHQCYQLTDKSDVYSFGVVLIELISSMPAVDISRDRQEINLANLAMNRIQNCAFDELVDPCLGFESNLMVRRMTTSVAELAFRCLQQDKEMRPSMDEVLEVLKGIESEKYEADDDVGVLKRIRPPNSPDSDHVQLLKNMRKTPSSPISVTDKWVSRSTTPSVSSEAFPHSA